MDLNLINSVDEQKHLKELNMFFSRGFMVTIIDEKDNVLFYPCTISNFSVDSKKLFVTVYDLIVEENVEEMLDSLISHSFFKRSPRIKIILSRLDATWGEVYHVNYNNCVLKNYHGKNFTYKSSEPYQWYLEFSIGNKEIVKSNEYAYFAPKNRYERISNPTKYYNEHLRVDKSYKEQDVATLKNSNKMLDEAIETIKSNNSISEERKNQVLKQVRNAQNENKKSANKYYGVSLDSFDFRTITKTLEKEIDNLEEKINK